ncbi:MAG TPA: hypothetical protein VGD58_11805 [Herpetosiphonaceae bacterium]
MSIHVLIIDADSGAAATTCAVVQRRIPNASIVCEATPERGWSSAQHTPPDLLLIDPAPYPSTGSLLIQLCHEWWPDIRVLVLASAPVSSVRRQHFQADAYLEKPASPARVLEAIVDLLQKSEPPSIRV